MRGMSPDLAAEPSSQVSGLLHPRRLIRARRRASEDGSTLAFGARLLATVMLTFALVGATAYLLLDRNLAQRQIASYAASLRADARSFEHEDLEGTGAVGNANAIRGIQRLVDAIAQRPSAREAVLIDSRHVIVAAATEAKIGTTAAGPSIDAALTRGLSYAGRQSDPTKDRGDFQFVAPVNLASGRYAVEATYDHRTFDAQVREIRVILALVGLLALVGGVVVFYVVGGRRLMRDHRSVLRRATRDGLTDLPNQRAFHDEFSQAVASAARYEDPFALAVLDVDDFKLINDRHGHPHGDAVLKRVADVLREARPG